MPSRVVLAVAALAAALASCGDVPVEETSDDPTPTQESETATPPIDPTFDPSPDPTVETFAELSRDHVEGTYDYPQEPPAGGPHNQFWQNCGFYDQPVQNENAVHSLEHGAVWITYTPDLRADQIDLLGTIAANDDFILVSPYDGLPSPVVASAWGVQVKVPSATDPALERFLAEYVVGPQTPEPGAPCSGGIGDPVDSNV